MSSRLETAQVRTVLYEGPGAAQLDSTDRTRLLAALLDNGFPVTTSRNLAHFTAAGHVLVLGRFESADVPIPPGAHKLDIAEPAATVEAAQRFRDQAGAATPGAWKPWFPVIDFKRCTNCMQCLSFCLFDVYGVSSGGKIEVRNQDNCKTDCPACSRVCPEVAIMFPKYRHGPINGDQVSADDIRREAMKVDISALLGGDVYALLRDRSAKAKSRFSKERDDERALKERQNCLLKLQKEMDIPMEVLTSLPSPDEIRAKAEQAAARARQALNPTPSAEVS
ncbi:MAG: ferredoxin family protein [Bryobacterales bacterium]|nr:ferredoxin family protein [Bryobacterales bacterium]